MTGKFAGARQPHSMATPKNESMFSYSENSASGDSQIHAAIARRTCAAKFREREERSKNHVVLIATLRVKGGTVEHLGQCKFLYHS